MKTKKTLFLKKVTIANLSQKDMNHLRGGITPSLQCTSGVVGTVNFCAACYETGCNPVE
ncbi:MAG: TIGR04149 family rSAM-modified RiPP [Candidatus Aminicenantes bacterium]